MIPDLRNMLRMDFGKYMILKIDYSLALVVMELCILA